MAKVPLLRMVSECLLKWLCGSGKCEFWRLVARWGESGPTSPKLGLKTGRHKSRHTDQYHEVQERVTESDKHAGDGHITCN